MFFDPIYIVAVLLPTLAITGWAAWRVRSTYAKWSKVDSGINLDAFDFARRLLDRQGLTDVKHRADPGQADRPLRPARQGAARQHPGGRRLGARRPPASRPAAPRLSVAAAAVIAHEVGHALQDHAGDPAMKLRQAIVPAAQFGSGIAPWLIIAGVCLQLRRASPSSASSASARRCSSRSRRCRSRSARRARRSPSSTASAWSASEQTGARDVLKAAAWTYVAGALTALLTFLYYAWLIFGRRD